MKRLSSLDMVFPHSCISGQGHKSFIETFADSYANMVLRSVAGGVYGLGTAVLDRS